MKVLVQWSTSDPQDWTEIDSSEWKNIPKKPDPDGTETIDNQPGWINRVCVQGVEFTNDHYAVEDIPGGGCRVYAWSDDPEDYTDGYKNAKVFEFLPLAPDPNLGGAINTRQTLHFFVESEVRKNLPQKLENETINTYKNFRLPPENLIRHGVWLPQELYEKHEEIRRLTCWTEWTEGLPEEEVESGKLREQRKIGRYNIPDGTKTFYQSNTALAGVHTGTGGLLTTNETVLTATPAGSATLTSQNFGGGTNGLIFCFTTASTQPNNSAWPAGTYRCQINVSSVGADLTYGVNTQSGSSGHFNRVNGGLTADQEAKTQAEGSFTGGGGTGLKLATTGSTTWTGGATSDRFEVLWACQRAANHGNQSISITVGTSDSYVDGPWEADAVAANDAAFFGHNH